MKSISVIEWSIETTRLKYFFEKKKHTYTLRGQQRVDELRPPVDSFSHFVLITTWIKPMTKKKKAHNFIVWKIFCNHAETLPFWSSLLFLVWSFVFCIQSFVIFMPVLLPSLFIIIFFSQLNADDIKSNICIRNPMIGFHMYHARKFANPLPHPELGPPPLRWTVCLDISYKLCHQ